MSALQYISLGLNVAVLIPVSIGLLRNAPWAQNAFGPPTPARGILLSIYLSILVGSVVLLLRPVPAAIVALLGLQVLYKVTTPLTVRSLSNPVVVSNLCIAAVHIVTLAVMFRGTR